MSVKNRAFALAIGTGALIALSAPMASAASFAGPNGFNNDSVLNLSNNQVPIQACNNTIPVNVLGIQVPVTGVAGALSALGGTSNAANSPSCTQTPNQENGSSTTTG